MGQALVFPTYAGASLVSAVKNPAVDVQLRGCVGGCSLEPAVYPPGCLANTSASFMLLVADESGKITHVNATATPLAGMDSLRLSIPAPSFPFTVFGSSYGHASYAFSNCDTVLYSHPRHSYPIAHTFNSQVCALSCSVISIHTARCRDSCSQGMPLLPWCFSLSGLPCWAVEELHRDTA